jgi:hypothetical protein
VTAACALIHLGWQPRAALTAIAIARGQAIPETQEQEDWILRYKPLTGELAGNWIHWDHSKVSSAY